MDIDMATLRALVTVTLRNPNVEERGRPTGAPEDPDGEHDESKGLGGPAFPGLL